MNHSYLYASNTCILIVLNYCHMRQNRYSCLVNDSHGIRKVLDFFGIILVANSVLPGFILASSDGGHIKLQVRPNCL